MIKNGDVTRLIKNSKAFEIQSEAPNVKYRINTVAYCEKTDQLVLIQAFRHTRCQDAKGRTIVGPRIDNKSVSVILPFRGRSKKDARPTAFYVRSLRALKGLLKDLTRRSTSVAA